MIPVSISDMTLTIPTYEIGAPDKNPQFIEKRVYQGSSGKVYPYPVIESISDSKVDKEYKAVLIRNEYLEVTVLPELGGRIQYARDLTNNYDFVYRNEVIKPALVGLLGPWISGGIEFNWPQHHRPTTYLPVEYQIIDLDNGGKAVQCHDTDRINGTEVVTTIGLYPGKAYIAITSNVYNGTSFPQTFLWWANPAVPVNLHTKTVMPPDVYAVMDHGKRDVSRYPIATGTYYKHDYSEGVDIGRYKNIPVPTSYMAAHSDYDFVGGYDFAQQAGILHVADHHISPGKKQWTWGSGDFGLAWDRNLTDNNGPYAELMTGVYTDNQPDFTWLKPFESKSFSQYFMPYKQVGLVKNATIHAAVNLEFGPVDEAAAAGESEGIDSEGLLAGQGRVIVYATEIYEHSRITVQAENGSVLYSQVHRISPYDSVSIVFDTKDYENTDISVTVRANGETLVAYKPQKKTMEPLPQPAEPIGKPEDMSTNEELFFAGLHLEQYRHATYLPDPYYREGLRRDPYDSRINNAYGLLLMRRGDFQQAKLYFERAIQRLTQRNPNPYNSEAYFNLGVVNRYLGDENAAYEAFYKSVWDGSQQERGYYYLALISAQRQHHEQALAFVTVALSRNTEHIRARALRAFLLRKLCNNAEALIVAKQNIAGNAFDFVSQFECFLSDKDKSHIAVLRGAVHNYLNLAREYIAFGAYQEALEALSYCIEDSPLVHYYRAMLFGELGLRQDALDEVRAGELAPSDYCFPNNLEDIAVLEYALSLGGKAKAPYYLGCLYYDKFQTELALQMWKLSEETDPLFPTVHRNLALAYYNKKGDTESALYEMEEAYTLDTSDARILLELDQLHRNLGWTVQQRLALFSAHREVVNCRDDVFIEYVTLLNLTGQHKEALAFLTSRHFHPWEGGEGKVTQQYRLSLILQACELMRQQLWKQAKNLLIQAQTYPENLGEGKLEGQKDNDLHYLLGVIARRLGDEDEAVEEFTLASLGSDEVKGAMYYNDQPAEMVLYQGLALRALGDVKAAHSRFYRLLDFGEQHLNDEVTIDYFAVSLPDFLIFDRDYSVMNRVHCWYLMGLSHMGMGQEVEAATDMENALHLDPSHIQANVITMIAEILDEQ